MKKIKKIKKIQISKLSPVCLKISNLYSGLFRIISLIIKPESELSPLIPLKLNAAVYLVNKNRYELKSKRVSGPEIDIIRNPFPII